MFALNYEAMGKDSMYYQHIATMATLLLMTDVVQPVQKKPVGIVLEAQLQRLIRVPKFEETV